MFLRILWRSLLSFAIPFPVNRTLEKGHKFVPVQESKIMRGEFFVTSLCINICKMKHFCLVQKWLSLSHFCFFSLSISLLHFFVSWFCNTVVTDILDYPVTRQRPSDLSISLIRLSSPWLHKFSTNYQPEDLSIIEIHRFNPVGIIVKEIDPRRL